MDNAAEVEENAIDHRQLQQHPRFQHLPNDVQRHILKLVIDPALNNSPFRTSHLTYAQVCRQWKSMIYSLIVSIDIFRLLHDLDSSSGQRADRLKERFDQVLWFLRKNKETIRSLKVDFVDVANGVLFYTIECWREFLNHKALDKVLRATPQLEALHMVLEMNHSETEALKPSIKSLSSLKSVALSEHELRRPLGEPFLMHSHILNGLAEGCPALEVLKLYFVQVSDENMTKIGQLRRLKEFFASFCSFSDRGMQALCSGSGSIELLSLLNNTGLTNQSARAIATGAATQTHLKELTLKHPGIISGGGLCNILDRCEKLSSLDLSFSYADVEEAFWQYAARWPSRRLNVRRLRYVVRSDCTFPVENFYSLECLCLEFEVPKTEQSYWTESRVLGLSGLSNLRCLAVHHFPPPLWNASAVRALGQFPKLDSLVIGSLDEAAMSALIDCFSKRLIWLCIGRTSRRCIQTIVNRCTKLVFFWAENVSNSESVSKSFHETIFTTVSPFVYENFWEVLWIENKTGSAQEAALL